MGRLGRRLRALPGRLAHPGVEGRGYYVWLVAGAIFAVPEIWASADSDLPFPTLSGTVGHLERRWEIVSLAVILVLVYALMHAIRVGVAVIAGRTPRRHIRQGRITRTASPSVSVAVWLAYFPVALVTVAAGFVVPLWVHDWHASDAEKQLAGEFGYGAMALAFFLLPAILARVVDTLPPFPGLFQTVLNLEARVPIFAVLVAGSMAFLALHLVLYPYPSIIPWFQNLEHLHTYCVQHPLAEICRAVKK